MYCPIYDLFIAKEPTDLSLVIATGKLNLEESKSNPVDEVRSKLLETASNEAIENPGERTCINLRYINKTSDKKASLIECSETFVNPLTKQQLFVSDHGIFLYDSMGALVPFTHPTQIRRHEAISEMRFFVIMVSNRMLGFA